MKRSSRNRLTEKSLGHFPTDSLFDKVGRAVCEASCLPRKELFEAWEFARRVRRRFRGGRIVDLACGHGLVSALLLILDNSSPLAMAVDRNIPASARRLYASLIKVWPRLEDRIDYVEAPLEDFALAPTDLVVSVHACGGLTDLVLERATASRAHLAVLPCCHNLEESDQGALGGWIDGPLAVDIVRASRLQAKGYKIFTQQIPSDITPKNRLLMGFYQGKET